MFIHCHRDDLCCSTANRELGRNDLHSNSILKGIFSEPNICVCPSEMDRHS